MDFQLCFGKRGRAEFEAQSSFWGYGCGIEWFPATNTLARQGAAGAYFLDWNPHQTTRMVVDRQPNLTWKIWHIVGNYIGFGRVTAQDGSLAYRYGWVSFSHWFFPLPFAIPIGRWLIRWCRGERWKVKGECAICGCYLRVT